jgi:hypothetical protein
MQAPGRPEEDTRAGFELGGWAGPNVDGVVNPAMGARMPRSGGLLLGRRSYEDMLSYWTTQDSPFKDMLDSAPKYVASRMLREPLPWPNSTLLSAAARPHRRVSAPHPPARARGGTPAVRRRRSAGLASSRRQHGNHNRRPYRHLPTGALGLAGPAPTCDTELTPGRRGAPMADTWALTLGPKAGAWRPAFRLSRA